jgi:hypothetical protein
MSRLKQATVHVQFKIKRDYEAVALFENDSCGSREDVTNLMLVMAI